MPRLPALLLAPLLLLAAPTAQAGNVLLEGFVLRGDGVELHIGGNHRHVPHGWGHPDHRMWHHGWQIGGAAWGHARVQRRWPQEPRRGGGWQGHRGYGAQDVRRAWRQGFQAGRRHDDGPRWHSGRSR